MRRGGFGLSRAQSASRVGGRSGICEANGCLHADRKGWVACEGIPVGCWAAGHIARAIIPASVSERRFLVGFDERRAAAVSWPPYRLVAAPFRVCWLGILVEVVDWHGVPATVPA